MDVICDWITCKRNIKRICTANSIHLQHVDNDAPYVEEDYLEALECQEFERRENK